MKEFDLDTFMETKSAMVLSELYKQDGVSHKELAENMGFVEGDKVLTSKVVGCVTSLAKKGFVEKDEDKIITITAQGKDIAKQL